MSRDVVIAPIEASFEQRRLKKDAGDGLGRSWGHWRPSPSPTLESVLLIGSTGDTKGEKR